MSVEWNRFWCRVLFKEFIKHFRKLNDEQIVKDVRQSMDDLEDLVPDTDSFGSQMVRWSLERADEPFAVAARENGKKGGRPRKETTADRDIREDSQANQNGSAITRNETRVDDALDSSANNSEARQSQARESQRRAGADSVRGTPLHSAHARSLAKNSRFPNSREEFHAFVADNNLHDALAEEWYAIHEARGWVDENGNPIKNWRGALKNFCIKVEQKRKTA